MIGLQKLDKILLGIALLLSACGQPQVSTTTQPSAPAAEQKEASEENIGIQRVTLASLQAKPNAQSNQGKGIVLPEIRPLELQGSMTVVGSPIVFRISDTIVERFKQEGFPSPIEVASVDTAESFALFCQQGKADIVHSARRITESEAQACAKAGRKPIAFTIATDALTIFISRQNEFLPTGLTKQELKQVFTAEQWSDVNPDWPDQPIKRIISRPPSESLNLVVKAIFDGDANLLLNAPNQIALEDSEQLIREASTNPDVISFLGYANYINNETVLKPLSINGVPPSGDKNYPLNRPLYIYADENAIRSRPELKAFINYYLTNVNEEVAKLGYFPANPEALEESKAKLKSL